MEFFQAKLVVEDPQARSLFNPEAGQSTLHELNGLSAGTEPITPARSFVKGRPGLGSSNRSIPPW
jgi:hypothetical protein